MTEQLEDAARKAVETYNVWVLADGIFPDPEYDNFMHAMQDLHELLDALAVPNVVIQ